jgi:hypothetical protein
MDIPTNASDTRLRAVSFIAFAVAVIFGFGVWAASPYVVGRREPWDANFPFYSVILIVTGLIVGWLLPRKIWLCFLGVWLGQVFALAVLPGGQSGWLLLGIITTGLGSLISLIGWLIGSFIASQMKRFE